ncbi:MAG: acyl carrier protein [Phycisphaerales bacterium]|nr:acyl carrier protein [Phycisphaerales bacterium]
MTRDEIFNKVRALLVDALGVDEDEVTSASILTKDLGAESIDFLDITFKLEQAFGFKIPQGELFPDSAARDPKYVQDGRITAEGLGELKKRLPHVDFSQFEKDPQLTKVASLFTVDTLVRYVERKLNKQPVGA